MSTLSDLFKKAETAHRSPRAPEKREISLRSPWSDQQNRFLQSTAPKMVLTALAGSGKSSLLMEYARLRPHQKWNFIVFNRSVAQQWSSKSPSNVSVRTVHQLAFSRFGTSLSHKIGEVELQHVLGLPCVKRLSALVQKPYARVLLTGLSNFILSDLPHPSSCHVPQWDKFVHQYSQHSWDLARLLEDIVNTWALMLDEKSIFPMSHDGYVKRFCMSDAPWKGDFWMLDEGQDWSDALLSSFQKHAKVSIRAGDPFQRIYEWRGASSRPWCDPKTEHEFWLTHSFRTGVGPEHLVNVRLASMDCPYEWSGLSGRSCVVSHDQETLDNIRLFAPTVMLASNWNVLSQMKDGLQGKGIPCALAKEGLAIDSGIVLSTIHAAKGLEFDRVWICDDALPVYESQRLQNALAYVALTRAHHALRAPSSWTMPVAPASSWADVSGIEDAFE